MKPVALTIHLLTMRGYVMQQELVKALRHLACTEDECFLHMSEIQHPTNGAHGGFEVRLHCRRTLHAESPWTPERDERYPEHKTYHAVFDGTETLSGIVGAIRQILDTPLIFIQ